MSPVSTMFCWYPHSHQERENKVQTATDVGPHLAAQVDVPVEPYAIISHKETPHIHLAVLASYMQALQYGGVSLPAHIQSTFLSDTHSHQMAHPESHPLFFFFSSEPPSPFSLFVIMISTRRCSLCQSFTVGSTNASDCCEMAATAPCQSPVNTHVTIVMSTMIHASPESMKGAMNSAAWDLMGALPLGLLGIWR
jgi:hypothetical protein